jgi:hypothetical protein
MKGTGAGKYGSQGKSPYGLGADKGGGGEDDVVRDTDSLGRTLGPYGVYETPKERRTRYLSLWLAALNIFVDALMFPILIPTVSPCSCRFLLHLKSCQMIIWMTGWRRMIQDFRPFFLFFFPLWQQLFFFREVIGMPVEDPGGVPPEQHMTETFKYAWLFVTFSTGQVHFSFFLFLLVWSLTLLLFSLALSGNPSYPWNDGYLWTLPVSSLSQLVFTPIFNIWYERWGIKGALLCSKAIMVFGNFFYAFSENIW